MAQFKTWPILKLATRFKSGQPILKTAGPFSLCNLPILKQTRQPIVKWTGQPVSVEMGQPVLKLGGLFSNGVLPCSLYGNHKLLQHNSYTLFPAI